MPSKGHKIKPGSLAGGKNQPFKGKRGSGQRFKAAVRSFSHQKGVRNPRALAGAIARAKNMAPGQSGYKRTHKK